MEEVKNSCQVQMITQGARQTSTIAETELSLQQITRSQRRLSIERWNDWTH